MSTEKIHIVSTRKMEADLKKMAFEKNIIISDFDFLHYEYLQTPEIIETISNNSSPLIFTSQHAIKALDNLIKKNKIKLICKECYTITGITENLAIKYGFNVLATAKDSNELADKIIEQKRNKLIFCCSNIRLNYLKDKLINQHINLQELEIYKKQLTANKVEEKFDGIMFYSPSQIDAFLQSNKLSSDTPAFCIGSTTTNYLKSKQHLNCFTSKTQTVKSVLDFAIEHFAINK